MERLNNPVVGIDDQHSPEHIRQSEWLRTLQAVKIRPFNTVRRGSFQ
jgi:hypothetical protein